MSRSLRPGTHVGRIAVTAAAVGALSVTGIGLAAAATHATPNPSSSASTGTGTGTGTAPAGPGRGGAHPGKGRPGNPQYDANGVIIAVSGSSLTVRDMDGTSRTYALDSSTVYHAGPSQTISASDLRTGQRVHVAGQSVNGGSLRAVNVDLQRPHLDGTVTALGDSTITIVDREGFTRTIRTSSATQYPSTSRSALTPGTAVHAEGTVDADGSSLDATSVSKAPARPEPGAGPGRGSGAGGTAPARPSGAPAPSGAPTAPSGAPAPSGSNAPAPSAAPSSSGS